jgi:hypothetical protein
MRMKLTNAEILNLFNTLSSINVNGNAKFTFTVAKNRASLKTQVESLQEAGNSYAKNNDRFKQYQERGDALIKQFSTDAQGKPVVRGTGDGQTLQRMIPQEKMADFTMMRTALDEEFKEVILGAQLHQAEFQRLLREEAEVDLRLLKISDVPSDGINTQVMNSIYIFIDDEEKKADVIPLKEVKKDGPPESA